MYTIKGKEYSEVDINKRCAELMALEYNTSDEYVMLDVINASGIETSCGEEIEYNPCNNPSDTWPIIEKCWDELICGSGWNSHQAYWGEIMEEHKCTKLAAACICLIELN